MILSYLIIIDETIDYLYSHCNRHSQCIPLRASPAAQLPQRLPRVRQRHFHFLTRSHGLRLPRDPRAVGRLPRHRRQLQLAEPSGRECEPWRPRFPIGSDRQWYLLHEIVTQQLTITGRVALLGNLLVSCNGTTASIDNAFINASKIIMIGYTSLSITSSSLSTFWNLCLYQSINIISNSQSVE